MYTLMGARAGTWAFELYRLGEGAEAPVFALVDPGHVDKVGEVLTNLKFRLAKKQRAGHEGLLGITELRQFRPRNASNDRRINEVNTVPDSRRRRERRGAVPRLFYRSEEWLMNHNSEEAAA